MTDFGRLMLPGFGERVLELECSMAEDGVPLDPSVWGGSCSTALALAGCESAADTDPRFLKKAFVLLRMLESGPSVGLLPPLPPLFELRTDSTVDVLPNARPPAVPCLFLVLTLPALARPLSSTSTSIGAPLTMMDPGSCSAILEILVSCDGVVLDLSSTKSKMVFHPSFLSFYFCCELLLNDACRNERDRKPENVSIQFSEQAQYHQRSAHRI
jgi:hypothetical protein